MHTERWRRRWRKKLYGERNAAKNNVYVYSWLGLMLLRYTKPSDYSFRQLTVLYLLASFLYYELDFTVIPDESYDRLCSYLLKHYDEWKQDETIWHRKLIKRADLRAGTAFQIRVSQYPEMITRAANYIVKKANQCRKSTKHPKR